MSLKQTSSQPSCTRAILGYNIFTERQKSLVPLTIMSLNFHIKTSLVFYQILILSLKYINSNKHAYSQNIGLQKFYHKNKLACWPQYVFAAQWIIYKHRPWKTIFEPQECILDVLSHPFHSQRRLPPSQAREVRFVKPINLRGKLDLNPRVYYFIKVPFL